jgi:hypothetical protein
VISRLHRIKHTPCRNPLNEWPRHRGRFLHNTPETNINALSGIRTREPSSRGAADLHIRQYKPPGSATSLQSSLYYYFRAYIVESCRSFADRKVKLCKLKRDTSVVKQGRQCTYTVPLEAFVQPLWPWKSSITYYECVFLALVIHHTVRMRHIVFLENFFHIFSQKARFSGGGSCFWT